MIREFLKNSKKMQKFKEHHYGFISSQNGTGQAENNTKKNVIVPIHSNPTQNREFQKNSKKIQKILNTSFWPLFRPKCDGTSWEWVKIKSSLRSIPARPGIQNSKKRAKKFKKTKKTSLWLHFKPKRDVTGWERYQKKNLLFQSIPTKPGIGISKKREKNWKSSLWLNFKQKGDGTIWEWYQKKSYCSDPFLPDLK